MKVVFLSFDFGEYCVRLASALAQEVDVCLLLPDHLMSPYVSLLAPGMDSQPFKKPRLSQLVPQLRMVASLLRYIRHVDPDVVHMQSEHFWFNLAFPFLQRYPLVVTIHDPRSHIGERDAIKVRQWITDYGHRRGDQCIVHATRLKQVVMDRLRIPNDVIHVIPHVACGADMGPPDGLEEDHLILFFGRIWQYKGLDYLIRAEPLITAQVPNARILIAGQGENFARYRRMMVHPGKFTVYNEYLSDTERDDLFRRASLVALPYIDASQSGVIPIAYTFAKPVVATTVGGLPDQVDQGRTGFLVPPHDERALADAIVRLLRDKALRHQMGANGKRKVESEWAPCVVAQQTLAVYHRAIKAAQANPRKRQFSRPRP